MFLTVLIWLCVLTIPVLFVWLVVVTAALAMWEQRVVWYFIPVEDSHRKHAPLDRAHPHSAAAPQTPLPPPSVESSSASAAARDLGFKFLGTHRDAKGERYRVRYDFWIAPERDVLVSVGCGTIMGMGITVDARWLYTRLQDGRLVITVSDQSGSEYDLSGQRIEAVVSAVTFEQLLAAHRLRVSRQSSPVLSYGPDPLKDHRASVTQRVELLVRSGYAKHLDAGQDKWSYTLLGALLFSPLANGQALRRSIVSDTSLNR